MKVFIQNEAGSESDAESDLDSSGIGMARSGAMDGFESSSGAILQTGSRRGQVSYYARPLADAEL